MVRLLAFIRHADPGLVLGAGVGDTGEPDLAIKDLTGAMRLSIDVGLPDWRRVKKSVLRTREHVVYTYGGRAATSWWKLAAEPLAACPNLTVMAVPDATLAAMAALIERSMEFDCMVQDGELRLTAGTRSVSADIVSWQTVTNLP